MALGDELGLSLGPHARVRALTPAERHQVELLALAHRGASVLLLDDWLAGLTEDPTEELLLALAKLRATGRTVLVATRPGGPLLDLLTWRTGSPGWRTAAWPGAAPVTGPGRLPSSPSGGGPLLQVKRLWVTDQGEERVAGADLDVRHGEIYGLAGAAGEGQAALIEAVVGLCRAETGRVYLGDEDVTGPA